MNSYEFIGMMIAGMGTILGVAGVLVKPILSVTKTMQELKDAIMHLTEQFSRFEVSNHDDHKRIWEKNEEQDAQLNEHDKRIALLEKGE